MFARVVHRQGWDVELMEPGWAEPQTSNFGDRGSALEFARSQLPEWIEVGVVVPEGPDAPQHHEWRTLRRQPDGSYAESGLSWGGPANS